MRAKVLKAFPYAADGFTAEQMVEGDVREFRQDLAEGLVAEGFIAPAPSDLFADAEAVVAPTPKRRGKAASEGPAA